jgi:hypothetical protein
MQPLTQVWSWGSWIWGPHLDTKKLYMLIFVMGMPAAAMIGRRPFAISSRSSEPNRSGTSPAGACSICRSVYIRLLHRVS